MLVMACPDWMRLIHASIELLNSPSCSENVRTPFDPSAWQDWHEFLRVSIQACWGFDKLAAESVPKMPMTSAMTMNV